MINWKKYSDYFKQAGTYEATPSISGAKNHSILMENSWE